MAANLGLNLIRVYRIAAIEHVMEINLCRPNENCFYTGNSVSAYWKQRSALETFP